MSIKTLYNLDKEGISNPTKEECCAKCIYFNDNVSYCNILRLHILDSGLCENFKKKEVKGDE